MNAKNDYIKIAELVHQAVVKWDPYDLIKIGAPEDEYDSIEKRFISGLINSESNYEIIEKVIKNLNKYGSIFTGYSEEEQSQIKSEINKIIEELRKQTKHKI